MPAEEPRPVVIRADALSKRYPNDTDAVSDISFQVRAGEIVGLVGPNGAGKSSTLNMIATLVAPTGGDASVCGISVRDHAAVRPLLGVALQTSGLDPLLSVRDHFAVQAALFSTPAAEAVVRTSELLDRFQLAPVRDRRANTLSGGTQRRVSLALALLHEPAAIIFDEPTVGLDPSSKRVVWDLLDDLREQGLAILFSTHDMAEADRLCDRIDLVSQGRIKASGSPQELKALVSGGVVRLRAPGDLAPIVDRLRVSAEAGTLPAGVRGAVVDEDCVVVPVEHFDQDFRCLVDALVDDPEIDIIDLSWGHGSLEDVFIQLTGEALPHDTVDDVGVDHRAQARRRGRR
jgi:ABC-2 type transport system ATP-binding protein